MTVPGVPHIRVGYMAPNLPYPVSLYLPPIDGSPSQTRGRTTGRELDIIIPQDPARHEKLGRFLEAWGALESTLTFVLVSLTALRLKDAHIIFPKFGMKNALDALEALGRRKLDDESANLLTTLTERTTKLNTKRNILVHGEWVLEANVLLRRGEAILRTQFLRQVTPVDPAHEKAMANPRNQKERVRYCFNLKRIDAATRDTDTLNRDWLRFKDAMKLRVLPLDEIPYELLLSKPYQVTYQSP